MDKTSGFKWVDKVYFIKEGECKAPVLEGGDANALTRQEWWFSTS